MILGFIGYMIPPKSSSSTNTQVKDRYKESVDENTSQNLKTIDIKPLGHKNTDLQSEVLKERVNSPSFGNVEGDITIKYNGVNEDEKK